MWKTCLLHCTVFGAHIFHLTKILCTPYFYLSKGNFSLHYFALPYLQISLVITILMFYCLGDKQGNVIINRLVTDQVRLDYKEKKKKKNKKKAGHPPPPCVSLSGLHSRCGRSHGAGRTLSSPLWLVLRRRHWRRDFCWSGVHSASMLGCRPGFCRFGRGARVASGRSVLLVVARV
jgi:hypothetical protein